MLISNLLAVNEKDRSVTGDRCQEMGHCIVQERDRYRESPCYRQFRLGGVAFPFRSYYYESILIDWNEAKRTGRKHWSVLDISLKDQVILMNLLAPSSNTACKIIKVELVYCSKKKNRVSTLRQKNIFDRRHHLFKHSILFTIQTVMALNENLKVLQNKHRKT